MRRTMTQENLNQKNCPSKRSFISSRICSQISRSSGPSSAMKIAPPTERKLKLTLYGREKSDSPRNAIVDCLCVSARS